MNVFNREWKKLLRLEKALDEYNSYSMPTYQQYLAVGALFLKVLDFGDSISDLAYYDLYCKYGDPEFSKYEQRLKMYVHHSNETKWYLQRQTLTENEFQILSEKYQDLKQQVVKCCEEKKWRYNV